MTEEIPMTLVALHLVVALHLLLTEDESRDEDFNEDLNHSLASSRS